jgi:hypothetical protein
VVDWVCGRAFGPRNTTTCFLKLGIDLLRNQYQPLFVSRSPAAKAFERASMASPLEQQAAGKKRACPSEREMEKCDPCRRKRIKVSYDRVMNVPQIYGLSFVSFGTGPDRRQVPANGKRLVQRRKVQRL